MECLQQFDTMIKLKSSVEFKTLIHYFSWFGERKFCHQLLDLSLWIFFVSNILDCIACPVQYWFYCLRSTTSCDLGNVAHASISYASRQIPIERSMTSLYSWTCALTKALELLVFAKESIWSVRCLDWFWRHTLHIRHLDPPRSRLLYPEWFDRARLLVQRLSPKAQPSVRL